MANLTEAFIHELRDFRLTTEKKASQLSIQVKDLLDENKMREYLDLLGGHMEAANSKAAGSIFMKRYAFLAVIFLYTMTYKNEKLLISFDNLSIETDEKEDVWLPQFYFSHLESETAAQDRAIWRRNCLETLFKEHLYPIIHCVSRVAKVSKLILWENIAIYIFWLYETVLQHNEIAEEDFYFIVSEAEGSLFGNYHENPLKKYFTEKLYLENAEKEIRRRKSCCYNYLTKSKQHCTSCPCMKELHE